MKLFLNPPSWFRASSTATPSSPIRLPRRYQRVPSTLLFALLLCPVVLVTNGNVARASNPQLCPVDRPCFNGYRQVGDKVIFNFTGITGWDFYNVRYAAIGGGEKQVENRSGHFTFNNVRPRRVYTLKVQGCRSRFLASSVCSPWVEQSVTTR